MTPAEASDALRRDDRSLPGGEGGGGGTGLAKDKEEGQKEEEEMVGDDDGRTDAERDGGGTVAGTGGRRLRRRVEGCGAGKEVVFTWDLYADEPLALRGGACWARASSVSAFFASLSVMWGRGDW